MGQLGHGEDTSTGIQDKHYPTEVKFPKSTQVNSVLKIDGGAQNSAVLASISS